MGTEDDNLVFQILDWDDYQQKIDDPDEDEDEENSVEKKTYVVRLFGRTKDQKTVYMELTDFKPYFFIEIPSRWNHMHISCFMDKVQERVWKKHRNGLIDFKKVEKHRFYGFTNYTKFNFLQLNFENMDASRAYANALNPDRKNKDGIIST